MDVVSLGILADSSATFRPTSYQRRRWGCELDFRFPIVKLLDWESRWEELENSENVFSLAVMAQIKAKTSKNVDELRAWKLRLVRLMYERGYGRETILELFRVIDWMIRLPEAAEKAFWTEYRKIEEEKKMPYITSVERFGMEKGIALGMEKGMERGLEKGSHATLRALVRNAKEQGLTDEMIGRIAGLDAAMVQKILRDEPVDLPLHLLNAADYRGAGPEAR